MHKEEQGSCLSLWGCPLPKLTLHFVRYYLILLPLVMCFLVTLSFCFLQLFLTCKFQSYPNKFNFLSSFLCNFPALMQLLEFNQTCTCRRVALNHLFANWRGLNHKVQLSGTKVRNCMGCITVYLWNSAKCENEKYTWSNTETALWCYVNLLFIHAVKYFTRGNLRGKGYFRGHRDIS